LFGFGSPTVTRRVVGVLLCVFRFPLTRASQCMKTLNFTRKIFIAECKKNKFAFSNSASKCYWGKMLGTENPYFISKYMVSFGKILSLYFSTKEANKKMCVYHQWRHCFEYYSVDYVKWLSTFERWRYNLTL
jgi:ATP-dependent RNA circularization protein (DNA/RNA ligase family)